MFTDTGVLINRMVSLYDLPKSFLEKQLVNRAHANLPSNLTKWLRKDAAVIDKVNAFKIKRSNG